MAQKAGQKRGKSVLMASRRKLGSVLVPNQAFLFTFLLSKAQFFPYCLLLGLNYPNSSTFPFKSCLSGIQHHLFASSTPCPVPPGQSSSPPPYFTVFSQPFPAQECFLNQSLPRPSLPSTGLEASVIYSWWWPRELHPAFLVLAVNF